MCSVYGGGLVLKALHLSQESLLPIFCLGYEIAVFDLSLRNFLEDCGQLQTRLQALTLFHEAASGYIFHFLEGLGLLPRYGLGQLLKQLVFPGRPDAARPQVSIYF